METVAPALCSHYFYSHHCIMLNLCIVVMYFPNCVRDEVICSVLLSSTFVLHRSIYLAVYGMWSSILCCAHELVYFPNCAVYGMESSVLMIFPSSRIVSTIVNLSNLIFLHSSSCILLSSVSVLPSSSVFYVMRYHISFSLLA